MQKGVQETEGRPFLLQPAKRTQTRLAQQEEDLRKRGRRGH